LAESLFAVFFPDQCRLCERHLDGFTAAPVCADCLDALRPADPSLACTRCGQAFETAQEPAQSGCSRCRVSPPPLDAVGAFGIHGGDLRRLIHLLKYERMTPLARPLAARMSTALARFDPIDLGAIDLIAPVPLYWSRRWLRGFNQSALLAKRLAVRNNVAYRPRALRRVRRTRVQAGLADVERVANMRGAFAATPVAVKGRRVLLVDDVMTTGATLAAAAAALKAAGASSVVAFVLARAERGRAGLG
jgi:ComF family protein